jgi:predicted nuclease of predicted toxin-antitoxin system
MIRFLLDQGTPRSAASLLRGLGWEAVHVSEIGLSRATDLQILDVARAESRVCVTLDADFHALLVAHSANSPSVVRIRIEGLRAPQMAAVIQKVVAQTGRDLENGAAVSVTKKSIRIRKLPLGR